MKRVLSTGDINATAFGNNDDHCDDDNGVFTQVRSRRNKKSKKVSPYVGQIDQFTAVPSGVSHSTKSVQATDDTTTAVVTNINGNVPDQNVINLQVKIEQLTAVVQAQQSTIDSLSRKLSFTLSFLNIDDDVGHSTVLANAANVANSTSTGANQPVPSTSQHNTSTAGTVAVTYANVASVVHSNRTDMQHPTNFREAVVTAMHTDQRDKERRKKSVVVSGLVPNDDANDSVIFRRLCTQELGIDPSIMYTRRLGATNIDRVRPLLVAVQSADDACAILNQAKTLRRSTTESNRKVFINRNMTKIEARLAYEDRCRRRRQYELNNRPTGAAAAPATTMMTTTATTALGKLDATTPSFIPQIITADVHRSGE